MITVDAIIAEYGQHYKQGGQGLKDLMTKLFVQNEWDQLFTQIKTDDTRIDRVLVKNGRVLQAYQHGVTPAGGVEFLPFPITLGHVKADDILNPSVIEETYLGFLASMSDQDRMNWPVVKYIADLHMNQLVEDLQLEGYRARFVTPVIGTAGTPIASMDGFRPFNEGAIAAGHDEGIISTGAPETNALDFVNQIEDFVAAIPKVASQGQDMPLVMSYTLLSRFKQGMREKYGLLVNFADATSAASVMDYPRITVKGNIALEGSTKWFCTPKPNMICAVKRNANAFLLTRNASPRLVDLTHDHYRAYGYQDSRIFFQNDQETTD